MGCGGSNPDTSNKPKRRDTVFGVLEIKVIEAQIERETSTFSTMDPYVNIIFSNQKSKGQVVKKGGKHPKFSDHMKFIVNSYFKPIGRCLQVELMDSNITSDDTIGFGIIDLDPYLEMINANKGDKENPTNRREVSTNLRCFINHNQKQAGFVLLQATFRQEETDTISLRFETADLKRRTSFGDMNCYVRVTAGQEVLQTSKSKDTKTDQPVWKDEHLTFTCPKSIQQILIEVLDDEKLVGSVSVHKLEFLQSKEESSFQKDIKYKDEIMGKVLMNSFPKADPIFKELKGDYKKITPESIAKELAAKQIAQAQLAQKSKIPNQQDKKVEKKVEQVQKQNQVVEKKVQTKREEIKQQAKPQNEPEVKKQKVQTKKEEEAKPEQKAQTKLQEKQINQVKGEEKKALQVKPQEKKIAQMKTQQKKVVQAKPENKNVNQERLDEKKTTEVKASKEISNEKINNIKKSIEVIKQSQHQSEVNAPLQNPTQSEKPLNQQSPQNTLSNSINPEQVKPLQQVDGVKNIETKVIEVNPVSNAVA